MKFTITHTDKAGKARSGVMETDHGKIETPIFMPVGTAATVKTIHQHELESVIKAPIILGNTYHLYLRPGIEIIEKAGGLHQFMNWKHVLLTDSGGYQVYSLAQRRKITEAGVKFSSHIDGSYHVFTPESAISVQRSIGADIIMAFDECTPYPCEFDYAEKSMHLTHRWLDRCINYFNELEPLYGHKQSLFPIVQGSTYPELREQSAEYIASKNCEGNAIGGLSVGEPHEDLYAMTDLVCSILPADKPRYLMGVGTPANLLECIDLGVDMFDCVLPTRNARHGLLYTWEGVINIKNAKWKDDMSVLDSASLSPESRAHSKAYIRHLFQSGEILGMQIASLHNLSFFLELTRKARGKIIEGTFRNWKNSIVKNLTHKL